ncbi:2-isopropylmalate synthase [Pendulispora albinea]|uniref:2-isopropylmalate synthase n=1 Tax=Pendulispora albinea TaxID=2741071 RepID=A0ABZ2LNF7_9BACT
MSDKITILDTTLRDGEQSAGVNFTRADKLEIARMLEAMRIDVIEAGFPAASAAEFANVQAVAKDVRGSAICALARAVPEDIDAATEALKPAAEPRIHIFLNSSDTHLAHQLRKSREDVRALAGAMVQRARTYVADVEFSPMDATRADPDFLAEIVRTAIAAGATTINLPDTVGYVLPHRLHAMILDVRAKVPELGRVCLSFHGQDDLGLSTANTLEAVRAGARQVELTVNGIGERAGNTALEEVVMALRLHGPALGVHVDVDTTKLAELSQLVAARSGMAVAPNKALVGKNAFRHASGIHQDGVLKKRETFEWIDPAMVGNTRGTEIVLGKLSGRAGFLARVRALGVELSKEREEETFARFQALADQRPMVDDAEIRAICREGAHA